tara:strand:+ start:174 stop:635 length:462 start_codon:yes stop_codon:yes gene_type:complete
VASQTIPFNGHLRIRAWEKQPDGSEKLIKDSLIKNLIVNVGKDTIMKRLGNMSGGGYITTIGVGDSTLAAASGQTDLQASTNKTFKTIAGGDYVYTRPTLFVSVDYGYSEANYTWNEIGLKDNNAVLVARQVDSSPLGKTTNKRAIVEWQLSI